MFTVEMDDEETLITILDVTGDLDDVSICLTEKYVFIKQWNDDIDALDEVILTTEMYYKLMQAWNLPTGTYTLHKKEV